MCEAPDVATAFGVRDRVALELLYGTAVRRAELLALDVDDVSVEERTLRVERGKGGKGRVVPFGEPAAEILSKYLQWVRPELLRRTPRERALLLNGITGRLGCDGLADIVAAAAVAAGIGRRVTPHALRHACATHMLENGADIRYLQELLGHASLTSTQVYTHVSLRHLRETYARCHPRERAPAEKPPEEPESG
jgi:site-specific recombinase XerD